MVNSLDLYNTLYIWLEDNGWKTYDALPPLNTPYPFAELGSVDTSGIDYKSGDGQEASITANFWGKPEHRQQIMQVMQQLLDFKTIDNCQIRQNRSTSTILVDNSVSGTTLLHGVAILYINI